MFKGLGVGVLAVVVAGGALASCSSDSDDSGGAAGSSGASGQAGSDSGTAGSAGAQGGSAGASGAAGAQAGAGGQAGTDAGLVMNCEAQLPDGWTPDPYITAVGHQGKCTPELVASVVACRSWGGAACLTNADFQACEACMIGALGSNPPPALFAQTDYLEPNLGGCVEIAAKNADCAAKEDAMRACSRQACDPVCPRTGSGTVFTFTDLSECQNASIGAGGVCESYAKDVDACSQSLLSNSDAVLCLAGNIHDQELAYGMMFCGGSTKPECKPYIPPGFKGWDYWQHGQGGHLGKCTADDVAQWVAACVGPSPSSQNCTAFAKDHVDCRGCLSKDRAFGGSSALMKYGSIGDANYPACLESVGKSECAKKWQDVQDCAVFACLTSCAGAGVSGSTLDGCWTSTASDPAGVCGAQVTAAFECRDAMDADVLGRCFGVKDPDAGPGSGTIIDILLSIGVEVCGP